MKQIFLARKTLLTAIITIIAVISAVCSLEANGISAGAFIRWGDLNSNLSVDTFGEAGISYSGFFDSAIQVSNMAVYGSTIVSPVYGGSMVLNDTQLLYSNFDSQFVYVKIVNNGNTTIIFTLDTSFVSLSRSSLADSILIKFFLDSNNDSAYDANDPQISSVSLSADQETGIFLNFIFLSGISAVDNFSLRLRAYFDQSDTNGYRGANNTLYCGEGNPERILDVAFISSEIPPEIFINYPAISQLSHDTTALSISVQGTTTASDGDSVFILVNNDTTFIGVVSGMFWSGFAVIPADTVIVLAAVNHNALWGYDTILVRPGFLVAGTIDLGIYDSGAIAKIYNSNETFTTLTDASGSYTLRVLAEDTFTVLLKKNGFKHNIFSIFINSNFNIELKSLISGDFFSDNSINIKDTAFIKKYWMKYYPDYDIDGDNIIGIAEKNAVLLNFNK